MFLCKVVMLQKFIFHSFGVEKLEIDLKKLRFELGYSQEQLGAELGVTKQQMGRLERGESQLTEDKLQYLKTKYGSMLQSNIEETIPVDYYPEVFGSCGSGKFVMSEQKELIQVPKRLFKHFSSVKKYSVINAIGDSMSPNIHDKDRLIVEHWEGGQIKDNKVYVFCYKDEIFVKRLIKNIDEIIVQSDNPDPIYRPRYIEKEEMNNVLIVGEIVGLMRDLR